MHAASVVVVTAEPHVPGLDDPDAPGWRRAPVGQDGLRNDTLMAVGLLIGGLLSLALWQTAGFYDEPAPGWVSLLCIAGTTLPLALRRRYPSVVAVVVGAVFIVLGVAKVPETLVANIALFVSLYTVGAWEADRRRATWVRVLIIVAMFTWLLIALFVTTSDPESLPDFDRAGAFSPLVAYLLIQLLTNVVYFAGAYWFGNHAWASARERARTLLRTLQLERERQRVAAQAVTLERLRLARELHDAVAHHVSLMGVQAAAARTLLSVDPARATEALEHVETSAREAISELHGILGTLRDTPDDDGAAGRDEGVGSLDLTRLPALVEESRAAGVPTTFQVVGEAVRVPPLVALNLYRVAQEALTNVRKHAGPRATADLRLRYLADAVELEVTDDGTGVRGATDGGGLGLVGMRERVASDGGTLVVGPRARGGFLVRAHVPLATAPTDAQPSHTEESRV